MTTDYTIYSEEAERALIAAVMIDPNQYQSVASIVKPEDFYLLRHGYIWRAFERLHDRGEPVDPVTLAKELETVGQLDNIGGRSYLLDVANANGTSVYAKVYAQLVERTSIRRKLLAATDDIRQVAIDESLQIDTVLKTAQERIFGIQSTQVNVGPRPIYDLVNQWSDELERAVQLKNAGETTLGIPSGFRDLDAMLGGFQRSDLLTLAGRPGMGKTSWMLTTGANAARAGQRVFFVTLEMPASQFVMRLVAAESGINVQRLRLATLTHQELARITEVIGRISNWQIWIWDATSLTVSELGAESRRIQHEYGLDLLLVDYLQLMHEPSIRANRVQEISYMTRRMKQLARDLNAPVIQGAQLSRAVEQRKDKRPVLSDLRESGSIENDSDLVMFLYRDEVYNEATEFPNQADVIVAKHRNGPTGTVPLYFEKSLTRFMDATFHEMDLSDI